MASRSGTERGEGPEGHVFGLAERFEADWPAEIDDYLPTGGPERCRSVVMLCNIDLELRWGRDRAADAASYFRRYPEEWAADRDGAMDLAEAEYRLRREHLQLEGFCGQFGGLGAELKRYLGERFSPRDERFQVVREYAKGGLGVVFVAEDVELQRTVAVKRLLPHLADHPTSRARLRTEAKVTAMLEHPAIVPIYGTGDDLDGRPYYAMRFVDGESLEVAVQRQRHSESGGPDPGRQSLELRGLLGRFVAICNAMDYAHSRGVIHRDVKPANVMLGRYGETFIVDWGLALVLGRPDGPGAAATGAGLTSGTAAYMAPEQAGAATGCVGPASDVYGLGALLYFVLTGQAPFDQAPLEGDDRGILDRVRSGEFRKPRQVDRGISPALEAVCLKAMAREPGARYASVRAMVDDVERWLAGEPVAAWREPVAVRARRWLARHRTAVAAGVVAVVVASIALSAVALIQRDALDRKLAAERDARVLFVRSMDVIARLRDLVATMPLPEGPADEMVRMFLEFYKGMGQALEAAGDADPTVRRNLVQAVFRWACYADEAGLKGAATAGYRQAITGGEALVRDRPSLAANQVLLAKSHNNLGVLSSKGGRTADALGSIREACAILEGLSLAHPGNSNLQGVLGVAKQNLAAVELVGLPFPARDADVDPTAGGNIRRRESPGIHEETGRPPIPIAP